MYTQDQLKADLVYLDNQMNTYLCPNSYIYNMEWRI